MGQVYSHRVRLGRIRLEDRRLQAGEGSGSACGSNEQRVKSSEVERARIEHLGRIFGRTCTDLYMFGRTCCLVNQTRHFRPNMYIYIHIRPNMLQPRHVWPRFEDIRPNKVRFGRTSSFWSEFGRFRGVFAEKSSVHPFGRVL